MNSNLASSSQVAVQIEPLRIIPANIIPTRLFYDLNQGPKYIKPNVTYWQHLTLDSYDIYEKVYNACKSPNGMIHFRSFLQRFNPTRPAPRLIDIERVWVRTLRDQSNIRESSQNKHLTMAVLYMLHVETVLNDVERPRIDISERELLKRFAKWIPCKCKKNCGKKWNFINGIGLFRGGSAEQKCGVAQYLQNGSLRNLFSGTDREALVQMREHWINNSAAG